MIDYAAVLADLEARRARLDAAIVAIAPLADRRDKEKKADVTKVADSTPRKVKRASPKCRTCGLDGHNIRTCPTQKPNGKVAALYRRCGECSQKTPSKGVCNHCGAKENAA